jgi:hypothetical protein
LCYCAKSPTVPCVGLRICHNCCLVQETAPRFTSHSINTHTFIHTQVTRYIFN